MMHRGYIKLWRKIEDWSWYNDSKTFHLFLHLLLKSNHKDTVYMGHPVPRGSCVTGLYALKAQTGISVQSLRTCIKRLKSTNDLTIKSTHHFSIICITNYEQYQENPTNKVTSNPTTNQQAINKQLTTSKECKNDNNEKKEIVAKEPPTPSSLEEAKKYFVELGNPSEAENFFDFYASKGWIVGRSPMKSWKHAARRWVKNQKNFVKKGEQSSSAKDFEERMAQVRREKENAKLYC